MNHRKKLIEVALPLEAINRESAREKSIRHGHPSTLHWWPSRKPLSAARAVLFASLVDDPSSHPEQFPTEEVQRRERQRLFKIIEELVKWENSNNEELLKQAHQEILKSTGGSPPPVYDPFCGGGSILLEAQRLGLTAYGSDINPVAVLITRALIEIPPKFAGRPPVNPEAREKIGAGHGWKGAAGLAEDIRYYGQWMREEAEKRIGHLYPKVKLPPQLGGGEATVIAWLWARTVKCPNPACGCEIPLASKFWLSTKNGKEAWVEPIVDKEDHRVRFEVRRGKGKPPEGTVNRRGARCVACGTPVVFDYIRSEGKSGQMGSQLMAIVAEGPRGRVYLEPEPNHDQIAQRAKPRWKPDFDLEGKAAVNVPLYGLRTFADLFTPRQLVALTTFSDLVSEARERVLRDALAAGMGREESRLGDGGTGAVAYADAVAAYLALVVDRLADRNSSICSWDATRDNVRNTFARQAIPITWDFAEANPLSSSTGNFRGAVDWVTEVIGNLPSGPMGSATQRDAAQDLDGYFLLSTDPPYYDNIGYADLSDFFYLWLRRALHPVYPEMFRTMLVPKEPELVATPYRFGGDKDRAKEFFEAGLGQAFANMRRIAAKDFPITVYYAFKQADTDDDDDEVDSDTVASTGWETMLEALVKAGFEVTGTWPVRTELSNRSVAQGSNALASSIVLVCRPRPDGAPMTSRKDFITALRRELPAALRQLQQGNIAPVDMAQAAIGPGMAIFSRYSRVLEADGTPMRVRTALQLINQELDAYLAHQEGDLDPDTRFCVAWYEQFGLNEAPFGQADVLARAKNTAVQRLEDQGVLAAERGKVRLLRRDELPGDFDPKLRTYSIWQCTQYLVRAMDEGGEAEVARLMAAMGGRLAEVSKALAYRLFAIADRRRWTEEALAYNTLVTSWAHVQTKAAEISASGRLRQGQLI